MTHDLPRNDADNGEPPLQVARQFGYLRLDVVWGGDEINTLTT